MIDTRAGVWAETQNDSSTIQPLLHRFWHQMTSPVQDGRNVKFTFIYNSMVQSMCFSKKQKNMFMGKDPNLDSLDSHRYRKGICAEYNLYNSMFLLSVLQ